MLLLVAPYIWLEKSYFAVTELSEGYVSPVHTPFIWEEANRSQGLKLQPFS